MTLKAEEGYPTAIFCIMIRCDRFRKELAEGWATREVYVSVERSVSTKIEVL